MKEVRPGIAVTPNIRLVRSLGEGGMGSVWLAEHLSLRTNVVVKFMSAELANSTEAVERFSREAAAAAQVKSPHVVQMLDHGVTADGTPFIVMELLEGHDLRKHLTDRGCISIYETAGIIGQVCKALSRAHERSIVHRDIKPDNIFLCTGYEGDTFVKLLDFGIAKGEASLGVSSGTKTGAMVGTPYYMSPEQIVGAKTLDWRTDLWSLGVVGYECIVGARPFEAENFGALTIAIHAGPIPVPSQVNPRAPAGFDAWFARACARDPAVRFTNAKELSDALAQVAAAADPAAHTLPLSGSPGRTLLEPRLGPGSAPTPRPAFASTPHFGSEPGVRGSQAPGTPRTVVHPGTNGGVGLATLSPRTSSGRGVAVAVIATLATLVLVGTGWALNRLLLAPNAPAASASAVPPVASTAPAASPTGVATQVPLAAPAPVASTTVPRVPRVPSEAPAPSSAVLAAEPAAAPAPTSAPEKPKATPAPKGRASAPKAEANCNPPFYFDAKGNRVFKPECL